MTDPLLAHPTPGLLRAIEMALDGARVHSAGGSPVVVTFDEARNLFFQFAPGDADGELIGEIVGQDGLAPADRRTPGQLTRLQAAGWTLAPDGDDTHPNHSRMWVLDRTSLAEVIRETTTLAFEVFGYDGRPVDIQIVH